MGGPRRWTLHVAAGIFAAALVLADSAVAPRDVEACGGFFSRGSSRKPSLSYEQALILHDPSSEKEHFIREISFQGGAEPFGFVVPTPTEPVVAKVEKSPFEPLRWAFPFAAPKPVDHAGTGFGNGLGRLGGGGGVTVLSASKVGSFTAFVLAADDEKGLARWLADNGLTSTPDADAWLSHYVRMKFYFVAMRYDPPQGADASVKPTASHAAAIPLKAETIRISFSTPVPYYPYFEPRRPPEPPSKRPPARLLELWIATPARVTPVVARTVNGRTEWVRPMQEGSTAGSIDPGVSRAALLGALGGALQALVPPGPLRVQTFQDQKLSREGYGDILFAPETKGTVDPATADKLRPLLGILDPTLVPSATR